MKKNLILFYCFFILLNVHAQSDIQTKANKIKGKLISGQSIPDRIINGGNDIKHHHDYSYRTKRVENNVTDSVLIRVSVHDSLNYLQFAEFHKKNKKTIRQYTYSINSTGVLDFAYRMEANNDSVMFDEFNPKRNKSDKEIQLKYQPRLSESINELYNMLFQK